MGVRSLKGVPVFLVSNVERSRIRLEAIPLARNCYADLPYHNFNHAMATADEAVRIAQRCVAEGLVVDELVVFLAGLFHDAYHHVDPKQHGFVSKEEYAAATATVLLIKCRAPMAIIKPVSAAILATHKDMPFTTVEQKIVRAADLSNFGGPYKDFLDANLRLKCEREMLGGKPISWDAWKLETHRIAEFYCSQDIRLTSAYANPDGTSRFHTNTRANVARFLAEDNDMLESLFHAQLTK